MYFIGDIVIGVFLYIRSFVWVWFNLQVKLLLVNYAHIRINQCNLF